MEPVIATLQASLVVVLTLLPIINPVGNAPLFVALTRGHLPTMNRMAGRVALDSWAILMSSMLVGTYVLDLFGISLAIVRLGGGMLIAATGWRLLHTEADDAVRTAVAEQTAGFSELEVARRSFFPMSFPLTAGPGSIATCIALGTATPGTPSTYLRGAIVAFIGTGLTCGIVYLCYRYATKLLNKLGDVGSLVTMRLAAFILLCVGLQMIWSGWASLNAIAQ